MQPEDAEHNKEQATDTTSSWNEETQHQQLLFVAACRELRDKVQSVETLQINILVTLLTANDICPEVLTV